MIKRHRRSRKIKESHGRSFPITRLTFQVRKVMGGVGWVVACRIIMSAPVPFLWTLDLGFSNWIWDLDLGLDLGFLINNPLFWPTDLAVEPLLGLGIKFRLFIHLQLIHSRALITINWQGKS